MGIIASDKGGTDFSHVPQGTHVAVCNMVVDLGHQKTTYLGADTVKHQCYIRWEIPAERVEWVTKEGEPREGPMSIGKTYTLSLSEKANLRKDLEAWRGRNFTDEELRGFDLLKVLGAPCMLTVTHAEKQGKTYANVKGLAGIPKGVTKPEGAENEFLWYSDDDRQHFSKLPKWLQDKIGGAVDPSVEPAHQAGDPGPMSTRDYDLDDEIPF